MIEWRAGHEDPYPGLLNLRNTPSEGLNHSPVQQVFGRRTKSTLQSSLSNPAPSARDTTTSSTVKEAKEGRKANNLDKHRRHLKQLCTGQQVHLKLLRPGEKEQQSAEMKKQLSSGNYDVEKLKEELCDATASSSELLAKPTPPDLTQTR